MSSKTKNSIREWGASIITLVALAGFLWEARGYVEEVRKVAERVSHYEDFVKEFVNLRERVSTLEEYKKNCNACMR